jgi:hypothetical protein
MRLYFTTVNRKAPLERGGEVVALDWASKRVLASAPLAPSDPDIVDPNPRGNTRGGRGIAVLNDREILVGDYHTLRIVGRDDFRERRRLSHHLFASIHEITRTGDTTFLVSSTAVDAAIEVDVATGQEVRSFHPRTHPALQRELGLTPLAIDLEADNRTRFLGNEHFKHPHHVHLNAVAMWDARPLALFSKQGAIVDLDRGAILARDNALRGSHNLLVADGRAYVNHTVGKGVLVFDLASGKRQRHIGWGSAPRVRELLAGKETLYRVRRRLEKLHLLPVRASLPGFARGLARHGGRLFVGIAPASILELDEAGGELVSSFTYSTNVDACIHGLAVDPTAS